MPVPPEVSVLAALALPRCALSNFFALMDLVNLRSARKAPFVLRELESPRYAQMDTTAKVDHTSPPFARREAIARKVPTSRQRALQIFTALPRNTTPRSVHMASIAPKAVTLEFRARLGGTAQ